MQDDVRRAAERGIDSGTDRTWSVERAQVFDESLSRLVRNYLEVADASRRVPLLSLWGFILLYAKFFRWGLCFYLALLVLLPLNGAKYLGCLLLRSEFTWWGKKVIGLAVAPFVSIHHGEIPAFKFLTLRGLVRLFMFYRLKTNLSSIALHLRQESVARFAFSQAVADAAWYKTRVSLIEDVRTTIGQKLGLAVWTSITGAAGVFGALKAGYEFLPDRLRSVVSGLPKALLHLKDESTIWLAGLLIMYLIWIATTNFVVLREILKEQGTYRTEQESLDAIGLRASREVPADLIGCLVFTLSFVSFGLVQQARAGAAVSPNALMLGIYAILPAYALIRRVMLNRTDKREANVHAGPVCLAEHERTDSVEKARMGA